MMAEIVQTERNTKFISIKLLHIPDIFVILPQRVIQMWDNEYIPFDWAIKRILRDKANSGVLEGLMTILLGIAIRTCW